MESVLYDAAGRHQSPGTMPGYHQGRPPRNKGLSYPAGRDVAVCHPRSDRRTPLGAICRA